MSNPNRPDGLIDLPLKGGANELEIKRPEPPAPPPVPEPAKKKPMIRKVTRPGGPPPMVASARRPPYLAIAAALLVGALATWFLKPDPPVGVLSTDMLEFGEVLLQATSDGREVDLANAGGFALPVSRVAVEGESADEFTVTNDGCSGQKVKRDSPCRLQVAFTPADTGPRRAVLVIAGEALNKEQRLPLLGLGIAPQLEADPLNVDFGDRLMGTTGRSKTLRVTNRGTAAIDIRTVELAGAGAGEFQLKSDGCGGQSLAPGERCSVAYAFAPSGEGEYKAELHLKSDAGDALVASPELVGSGLPRKASLSVSPTRLEFTSQVAGGASAPLKVTVTNRGTAALRVRQVAIRLDAEGTAAPPFELGRNRCSGSLSPGRSCSVEVLFKPPAEGDYAGVLEVRHDAGNGLRRVNIKGEGTAPKIFLDPLVMDFGAVAKGNESASKFLRVVNSGSGALTISEIRVRGAGAQAFTARPVGCTTAPIKPKSSCGVEVRFKPHRGGAFKAEVFLKHNAVEGPEKVELRGNGQL